MKSYKYIIVLLGYFLLFSLSVRVYANDPFKMVYPILSDTVINIQLNKSDTIDVSNLTAEQISVVTAVIEQFEKSNQNK